jgi:hypothetical protein
MTKAHIPHAGLDSQCRKKLRSIRIGTTLLYHDSNHQKARKRHTTVQGTNAKAAHVEQSIIEKLLDKKSVLGS